MDYQFNDGGRKDAGYRGSTGDCVVRAIAIATDKPYREVYDDLNVRSLEYAEKRRTQEAKIIQRKGSSPRKGVFKKVYHDYILSLGFAWIPTMKIGSGCKVHLKKDELPEGKLIARLSGHLSAVVDGVVQDTYDPSRKGTRCVYGYYIKQ